MHLFLSAVNAVDAVHLACITRVEFCKCVDSRPILVYKFILIFARDSIYAKRAYAIAIPSVCPSVRPSHGWISQKWLKLGSCNFHHTVAPSL